MKRSLLSLLCGSLALGASVANAFVVSDIRIDGLQRVSAGTVFNALPVSVGDDVDGKAVAGAAKALFRTGYFSDIEFGQDGEVLVVSVVERPSISNINIKGNKAIKSEDLLKGLKQAGLSEGEIFQQATLEAIRLELERQYVAQGRYGASIETKVEARPRNRVSITIDVKEGKVAAIKHMNIVGAHLFPKEDLLDLFELSPSDWLSWYSNNDKYSREKLSGDIERLRSWYLDRGYINFNISSTQVAISPDKEQVFITINVDEGDKFTINEVNLAGDLIVPEEEIRELTLVKSGQTFSRRLLTNTEEFISRRLGNEGYTFANVTAIPRQNDEDKTVDVTFFVEPGRRAYVRRINFSGNLKTDDEVLRREMRQMEGGSANTAQIEQSKVRLERLGFFKEVSVETPAVPGTSDQIDVNYTVEEQPSGSVTASVGFSQGEGLLLGGSVTQENFLGSGNRVSVALNKSDVRQLYRFSFNDPYFTVDGVSRGYDVFYSASNYKDSDISTYTSDTWGASMSFGYPLSETQAINFGFGFDGTKINDGTDTAQVITDYLKEEGKNFNNFKVNLGWSESELNRGLLPDRGYSQSLSFSASVPGSDLHTYKLVYRGQYFRPLTKQFTLRLATRLGYGGTYGSTSDYPFFENFYSGGFGSVRGYKDNTLGPRAWNKKRDDHDPIGGNVLVEGTVEVLFPVPFVKDQRSLRTSAFIDMGNVFDSNCGKVGDSKSTAPYKTCSKTKLSELRYSAGVGLTWITPMGPLSFNLAKALNKKDDDETQVFQFSLGVPF
ncbi:outer membrane protein assembly factor BamA [Spongorhabdus nitratireducens]